MRRFKRPSTLCCLLLFSVYITQLSNARKQKTHSNAPGVRNEVSSALTRGDHGFRQGHSRQAKEQGKPIDPESLCLKQTVLSIEDPPNSKGWMTKADWGAEFRKLDPSQHKYIQVGVDGFPCAQRGCCQHSMTIRPRGSDWKVLHGVINDYAEFLIKVLPWTPGTAILEGGGNIGVATSLLAFMYPDIPIVVLEPEEDNCRVLKNNTARFDNVHVKCMGLWGKSDMSVVLQPGGDGEQWGWKLKEVPKNTTGALQTTSVRALLQEFKLPGFDYVKMDIEGAEKYVFDKDADTEWLERTEMLSLELHGWPDERAQVAEALTSHGYQNSTHSEYHVYAKDELHHLVQSKS